MFAELSTVTLATMSPATSCSDMEFKASSNSPVHVMDFNRSHKPKTAMVVIPKFLLPNFSDNSLASALAKGAALANNSNTATENATFSCTEDSSEDLSSISTEEPSSSTTRRAIFSPYWKKSGEQPVELVPTGGLEEEVVVRTSAASVQSWNGQYEHEIQKLQPPALKPRLVNSDTALIRPAPPSILRKPKYSGNCPARRNTEPANATSLAIAGALATIEADSLPSNNSNRVKFNAKVQVQLFSSERPMQEEAQPGWSKMFAF